MSLKFKNVSCELGGQRILENLSGEIPPGKVTAILGPNGCGKSTLLRALIGLVPRQSGEIFLNEEKVTGLSERASILGYMPQAKEIYWPLTCEAIIQLSDRPTINDRRLEEIIERLAVSHLKDKRIDEISGGERTLVLLARALVNQPQIIVVDEPVSELDPAHQIQVMRILREEARRGAVVLVTMHDVSLTARYGDEVILMREGRVIHSGSVSETLTEKNLADVFKVSFQSVQFKSGVGFYAEG